jgi:hypothetical protein
MKPTRISGVLVVLGLLLLAAKFVVTATMTGSGPPQNAIETRNAQSDEAVQAQGLHTNDTVRQVWEAGVNPFGEISTSIYWVDNSTLLFSARNGPKPVSLQDAANSSPSLYLWKLGESPRPLGDNSETSFYRGARGIVCYRQSKIDPKNGETSKVWMVGPPGGERETSLSEARSGSPLNASPNHVEIVDCEAFADPAMKGRIYATDSNRRYYIDRTAFPPGLPTAAGENPVLMKADGSERRQLPIPPEEVGGIYFRTFENVFRTLENPTGFGPAFRGGPAVDGFQKWKTTNCLALRRIDPASGATDRMCIPFGLWSGLPIDASHGSSALITLIPTAAGLFFTSTKIYGQQGSRACRSVGPLQARKWRGAPRSVRLSRSSDSIAERVPGGLRIWSELVDSGLRETRLLDRCSA